MLEAGSVLHSTLLCLAVLNLVLVVVLSVLLGIGDWFMARLKELPLPADDELPSVSLVAPARNEERNIERAVRTLLTLDYPRLEITLVNDRSTDRTGEILDRLAGEFPRLNVVHIAELPAGWLGKNHAMQLGADRSSGEWILFTDADILFEPTTLKRAMGYCLKKGVDHLAATPDTIMPSWLLKSFVVTFAVYFSIFVRTWSIRNPRSTAHVGIGAFNLIRTEVYRALQGHRTIALRPDDDIKLGKIVKLAGYRQDLVNGTGMVAVEWYQSLGEMVRALEKNTFAAVEYSIWFTLFAAATSLFFNVWPFIGMFVFTGLLQWLYAAISLTLVLLAWLAARGMNAPQSCALGFPLAVLVFVYIQLRTMILNVSQGGMQWRDTWYSLKELKGNRV